MANISIGGGIIGSEAPVYIISEIGNNHNGDIEQAKKLIRLSAEAGVDAVKFQTVKSLDLVSPKVPANAYPGWDVSDKFDYWYQFLDTIVTPYEWYDELIEYTHSFGIYFISTPASLETAHFLADKKIDALKIASMDLNNIPFLKEVDSLGLPVILATGMATLEEIEKSVAVFKNSPLSILHCVSNYPLDPQDANLLNIPMLQDRFKVPVGFSNHALGYDLDIVAVGVGAKIIEKHFTLDRSQKAVAEHHFSMEPEELKEMTDKVRLIEKALGGYERVMTKKELHNRTLSRRSVTVVKDKTAGEVIQKEDLICIRPGTGLEPKYMIEVIGRKIVRSIQAYSLLQWEDLE